MGTLASSCGVLRDVVGALRSVRAGGSGMQRLRRAGHYRRANGPLWAGAGWVAKIMGTLASCCEVVRHVAGALLFLKKSDYKG